MTDNNDTPSDKKNEYINMLQLEHQEFLVKRYNNSNSKKKRAPDTA